MKLVCAIFIMFTVKNMGQLGSTILEVNEYPVWSGGSCATKHFCNFKKQI